MKKLRRGRQFLSIKHNIINPDPESILSILNQTLSYDSLTYPTLILALILKQNPYPK